MRYLVFDRSLCHALASLASSCVSALVQYFALALYTPEKSLLESRPNIAAWWKRVSERPSWAKVQELNEFAKK